MCDALQMHYISSTPADLAREIINSIKARKGALALNVEDFQAVDQFHLGGRKATLRMAEMVRIDRETRVLDVGGGIGGAARTLADRFGCEVVIAELMERYCQIGEALTGALGLTERVQFVATNALNLPFEDESFDLLWTQHSSMNIEDRGRLYREFFRVLRPGGQVAMHELIRGNGGAPRYPAPWSTAGEDSFLYDAAYVQSRLNAAGLRRIAWNDETAETLDWLARQTGRMEGNTAGALDLSLLLGPRWSEMRDNLRRNLAEDRCRVVMAIYERPE
jgi:SAM-dependent methyltransferase